MKKSAAQIPCLHRQTESIFAACPHNQRDQVLSGPEKSDYRNVARQ
jgi:hypothetical protein